MAGCQVVNEETLRGEIGKRELLVLALHVGDFAAVGAPAGLAGIVSDFRSSGTVFIDVIDVAHSSTTLAFVRNEANLAAIGRGLGVEFVHIWCICQVDRIRPIGVYQVKLPVAVAVGLVDDLMWVGAKLLQKLVGVSLFLLGWRVTHESDNNY